MALEVKALVTRNTSIIIVSGPFILMHEIYPYIYLDVRCAEGGLLQLRDLANKVLNLVGCLYCR